MKASFSVSSFPLIRPGKFLTGVAVFCMLINGLVPRYSIAVRDYDVLSQVMGTQTQLMQFFSFSTIPMNIVNQLMKDSAGTSPAQQHKEKQAGNSTDASTGFSIVSGETRLDFNRHASFAPAGTGSSSPAGIFQPGYLSSAPARSPVAPPIGIGFGLLLFFFLLPRSGIDDHAVIAPVRNFSARFANAIRVFYFFGGNR